jgi:hypothetical protein
MLFVQCLCCVCVCVHMCVSCVLHVECVCFVYGLRLCVCLCLRVFVLCVYMWVCKNSNSLTVGRATILSPGWGNNFFFATTSKPVVGSSHPLWRGSERQSGASVKLIICFFLMALSQNELYFTFKCLVLPQGLTNKEVDSFALSSSFGFKRELFLVNRILVE